MVGDFAGTVRLQACGGPRSTHSKACLNTRVRLTMIDVFVADIPNAENGFRLLFSATPFPGYTAKLEWRREEYGGNWYFSPEFKMEGWLCPALFKYFDKAPKEIYVKAEPKDGSQ